MSKIPSDAPPPYDEAVGSSSTSSRPTHLTADAARNGVPPPSRRSMEDETRDLPAGWIRQYDAKESHHFYVDTKANPPRSIWHHPYDDEQYLATLPSAERERLQELTPQPSRHDIMAWSSDEEDHDAHPPQRAQKTTNGSSSTNELPPRDEKLSGTHKFGRKMKDKLTSTTHDQREAERKKRAEDERLAYQAHLEFRRALQKATETGEPVKIGKDKNGKDVYVEPPMGYGSGNYGGYGGGYGVSPYGGSYATGANSRYVRPSGPYSRPYGRGYGGGYGLPIMGGLAGGLLLGDMLGGGLGMGGMGMGGMGMGGGMGGMGL